MCSLTEEQICQPSSLLCRLLPARFLSLNTSQPLCSSHDLTDRSWHRALSERRHTANNQLFVSGGVGRLAHSDHTSSAAVKCVVLSHTQRHSCCSSTVQTELSVSAFLSFMFRSRTHPPAFKGSSVTERIRTERAEKGSTPVSRADFFCSSALMFLKQICCCTLIFKKL